MNILKQKLTCEPTFIGEIGHFIPFDTLVSVKVSFYEHVANDIEKTLATTHNDILEINLCKIFTDEKINIMCVNYVKKDDKIMFFDATDMLSYKCANNFNYADEGKIIPIDDMYVTIFEYCNTHDILIDFMKNILCKLGMYHFVNVVKQILSFLNPELLTFDELCIMRKVVGQYC